MSEAALFDVVAVSPQGALRASRVSAPDAKAATERLQADGLRVLSCRPVAGAAAGARELLRRRASLDIGLFTEELAALLDAGLGMIDAIRTLAQKERDATNRQLLDGVAAEISEGRALSVALGQRAVFPPLLVASVAASEQTGDLVSALRRYSGHLETLRVLRAKLVGAAIYPALLLGVGMLVVFFLLGFVVPRFATLLQSTQHELPLASSILMGWGQAVAAHPVVFAGGALALFAGGVYGFIRAMRSGWQVPGLQRAWLIGPLVRLFRHAQFYRTSSMLVVGGIPALRAFEMSRQLLALEDQRLLGVALKQIGEGKPIGPALAAAQIADPIALRMLEVAQRTGRLADVLGRIASFQESALARAIDVTARLVEPILMVFIGLVIGGIVVLMYMPIFDLASSLQ